MRLTLIVDAMPLRAADLWYWYCAKRLISFFFRSLRLLKQTQHLQRPHKISFTTWHKYSRLEYFSVRWSEVIFVSICKNIFVYEDYPDVLNDRTFWFCYVNFRIGYHALCDEFALYKNTPHENKLCKCCFLNCIVDELHFLLAREDFSVIRSTYLPKFYCEYHIVFKMRLLMSSENPNIIKSIATYLYHPLKKRNSTSNP